MFLRLHSFTVVSLFSHPHVTPNLVDLFILNKQRDVLKLFSTRSTRNVCLTSTLKSHNEIFVMMIETSSCISHKSFSSQKKAWTSHGNLNRIHYFFAHMTFMWLLCRAVSDSIYKMENYVVCFLTFICGAWQINCVMHYLYKKNSTQKFKYMLHRKCLIDLKFINMHFLIWQNFETKFWCNESLEGFEYERSEMCYIEELSAYGLREGE